MYRSQCKKIHLNDVQCLELSNSEEGSRPLRMPMEFSKASRIKDFCLPRERLKRRHSYQEIESHDHLPHRGISTFPILPALEPGDWKDHQLRDDAFDLSDFETKMSAKNAGGFQPASQLLSSVKERSSKESVSGDFISARQFMNPTHHLFDNTKDTHIKASRNNKTSSQSNRSKIVQKNNLDCYFKQVPVAIQCVNDVSLSEQISENNTEVLAISPSKTVMRSPILKVPGTDSIYSSPNSNQNKYLTVRTKIDVPLVVKSLWKDDSDFENPSSCGMQCDKRKKIKLEKKFVTSTVRCASERKLPCRESEEKPFDISQSKFGLFGFSDSELHALGGDVDFDETADSGVDYFSLLPTDILENILCRLPFIDLHLNVNRVCTTWNDTISSPQFMPWKKKYNRLLKGDKEAYTQMEECLKDEGMVLLELYLPSLIRMMKKFKPGTARSGMENSLRRHPKFDLAKDLLMERFQDCFLSEQVPNPWCIIGSIVILSESVKDIVQITRCVLGTHSFCMASEILDGLYCIASYLWMFKSLRLDDVWNGMHYRLYYALYLYENETVSTVGQLREVKNQTGQQSIYRYSIRDASLRLTHEQMRICNHHIEPGQVVRIIAFAGTGKTTTLIQYSRMRPNTKFLLVVYNKSVCTQSKIRFPANVSCFTGHALAFREVGRKYCAQQKLGSNVRVSDVLNLLPMRKGQSLYVQAKFVVDTLNAFMASADPFITTAHVPMRIMKEDGQVHTVDHPVQMKLANDAENIWQKMINLQDKSIRLPHDGYLKLWQLYKPSLAKYDVILIDEAQDLTPCVADIFLSQLQPKILVGDPHQQIYSFRGAVNAMNLIAPSHTFYLTQSFRFGPEISFVAASCLELFKNEKKKILVGNGIQGGILGDQVGQLAVIARTNFQLFCEIVKKCSFSDSNIKVSLAGGIEGYGFDLVEDIYNLMIGNTASITHPLIKCFINGGFGEFSNFAQKSDDKELLGKLSIVTRFSHTVLSHINNIRKKYVADPELADVIFSTAHKAKGLEFDTVHLSDDFLDTRGSSDARYAVEDEYNLLYVAVTRAKKRLLMSMPLVTVLSRVGENFRYPVSTKQLKIEDSFKVEDGGTVPAENSAVRRPAVSIVKKNLRLSDGKEIQSEVYSPESISRSIVSMKGIAGLLIS